MPRRLWADAGMGKLTERWGRKATGLKTKFVYDSGVTSNEIFTFNYTRNFFRAFVSLLLAHLSFSGSFLRTSRF